MHRGLAGDDRPDATRGALGQVPRQPLAVEAGLTDDRCRIDVAGEVGAEDDPVAGRSRSDPELVERIGDLGGPGADRVPVAHIKPPLPVDAAEAPSRYGFDLRHLRKRALELVP